MGYRSEVAIAVSTEDYNYAPEEVKNALKECLDEPAENTATMVIFHQDWVKWYDDDELVQTIEKWLDTLNPYNYGMIRLGEDDNDVQYLGDPWSNGLDYIRKITF